MRIRLLSYTLGLLTVAAGVLAGGSPANAAATVQNNFVALGDSYAAGVGTLDYDSASGNCLRSPAGYPALFSAGSSSFVSEACSGATTADLLANQLGDLSASTDLVTVTIGGNDVGFSNVVATCLLNGDDQCTAAVGTAITSVNSTLVTNLDKTFTAIQNKAPNAHVIVTGYPRLLDPAATTCANWSLAKRQALNTGSDAMDTVIAARALAAGFAFADPRPTFAGHGVCSSSPWINDFSSDHVTETFHPTADGYKLGYLPAVTSASLPAFHANDLPAGYTYCSGESATCSFGGTRMVAFGAGQYRYRAASGSSACTSDTFSGDPAANVLKSCYVAPLGGPSGWTQCAGENGSCTLSAPSVVAYGQNGGFLYVFAAAGTTVSCTSSAFGGDPIYGVAKGCWLPPSGSPGAGWQSCSAENASCFLYGVYSVAYGANGAFANGRTSGTLGCTGTSFGSDPIYGVAKACYYRSGAPTGFATRCASDGGTCSFTGTRTVAYGEAGGYVYRTFTGSASCTSTAFGRDPAPYAGKSCWLTA